MSDNSLADTNDVIVRNDCTELYHTLESIRYNSGTVVCNECEFSQQIESELSIRAPLVVAQHMTRTQHTDFDVDCDPKLRTIDQEITVSGPD